MNEQPWLMVVYDPLKKTYRIEHEYTMEGGTFTATFPNRTESLQYLPKFLRQSKDQLQDFISNNTCTICFEQVSNEDIKLGRPYNACAVCYHKVCTECIFNIALSLSKDEDNVSCPLCRQITFTMTKKAVRNAQNNNTNELLAGRKNDFVIDYYI